MPTGIIDDELLKYGFGSSICSFCKNFIGFEGKNFIPKCKAFEKIPDGIWFGDNNHKNPFPGDDGIRFEKIIE